MTKEEIFELMKELILELRDHGEKLKKDERKRIDHTAKSSYIQTEVAKLNSCDANWLNDEYGKWYKKEVKPFIGKHL